MNVVILAAGRGFRFGGSHPKALTPLADGRTILERQLDLLDEALGRDAAVFVVVGFQAEVLLRAAARRAAFIYNEAFERTNTAASLLRALEVIGGGGVLWLNGDVVFEPSVLTHLAQFVGEDEGFVAVTRSSVGDEEVKYQLDADGYVDEISKTVSGSPGEAVGINYVPPRDRKEFARHLAQCSDQDYFERAIATSVTTGIRFRGLDITGLGCVEVDFESDLAAANRVAGVPTVPSAGG